MIGTTAALIAGSAIAAGSQVAGSVVASKGAKSAAKTQAEAATQAAQTQNAAAREALGTVRQTMDPYLRVGGQAVDALGSAMGFPASGPIAGAAPAPAAGQPPTMTLSDRYRQLGMAGPQLGTAGAAPPGYSGNSPYASAGTYPNYAPQSDPQQAAMQQSASSYGGQNGAPKMVVMRAPADQGGQTQMVPESMVQHYTQLGAQVVRS